MPDREALTGQSARQRRFYVTALTDAGRWSTGSHPVVAVDPFAAAAGALSNLRAGDEYSDRQTRAVTVTVTEAFGDA